MFRASEKPGHSVLRSLGFFTMMMLLVAVPLLAVGFWQDWFELSGGSRNGQWQLEFKVDPQEIKQDIGGTADKTDEWTERARQQGKPLTPPEAK